MHEKASIENFLKGIGPIYDVRSPQEFIQGTLPGALNLPLFSNEERALVGTAYKQVSPENALLLGLEFVGPKMRGFAETALLAKEKGPPRIFCARGGLRSQSMAWLFSTAGLKPITLQGGYKTFRKWVLKQLSQNYNFHVLGGFTGSGKTAVLKELKALGAQVIDLEEIAHHRGSSFGMLGQQEPPSTESFENQLAMLLFGMKMEEPIWIEDESRLIGSCKIPDFIYSLMGKSPLICMERPKEERISHLVKEYGDFSKEELKLAVKRLAKRLGGERTLQIIQLIEEDHLQRAAKYLLEYYDKTYAFSLVKRQVNPIKIEMSGLSFKEWAEIIKQKAIT